MFGAPHISIPTKALSEAEVKAMIDASMSSVIPELDADPTEFNSSTPKAWIVDGKMKYWNGDEIKVLETGTDEIVQTCLLYTSPSPRDS